MLQLKQKLSWPTHTATDLPQRQKKSKSLVAIARLHHPQHLTRKTNKNIARMRRKIRKLATNMTWQLANATQRVLF